MVAGKKATPKDAKIVAEGKKYWDSGGKGIDWGNARRLGSVRGRGHHRYQDDPQPGEGLLRRTPPRRHRRMARPRARQG